MIKEDEQHVFILNRMLYSSQRCPMMNRDFRLRTRCTTLFRPVTFRDLATGETQVVMIPYVKVTDVKQLYTLAII